MDILKSACTYIFGRICSSCRWMKKKNISVSEIVGKSYLKVVINFLLSIFSCFLITFFYMYFTCHISSTALLSVIYRGTNISSEMAVAQRLFPTGVIVTLFYQRTDSYCLFYHKTKIRSCKRRNRWNLLPFLHQSDCRLVLPDKHRLQCNPFFLGKYHVFKSQPVYDKTTCEPKGNLDFLFIWRTRKL